MTKEELLSRAINLAQNNKNIALQYATGVGKSKIALEIAQNLFDSCLSKDSFKILLLVAETQHKLNWKKEFIKWNKELLFSYASIDCYHSLKNHIDKKYDLIIFDEGHHSGSDIRLDYISTIKTNKVIVLSATLKKDHLYDLEQIFGKFLIDTVLLDEALKNGLLPEPKIYLIPLTLSTSIDDYCYIIEEWGKKDKRITVKCKYDQRWEFLANKKTKYPDLRLEITCTQREKYTYLCDQFEYFKKLYFRTGQEFTKNKWLRIGSERKRFLGDLKTNKAIEITNIIKDKRFICFCSSIEQAELLGNENSIHSKKNNNSDIIDKFNNKEISNIFAVNMLQEGQNLVDIDAGVIIQLDGEERSFIQRFGRSLRSKDPIQFILFYENTKDEEYLEKNVLNELSSEYIYKINDLSKLKLI